MKIFLEDILINSLREASFVSLIPRLLCVGVAWKQGIYGNSRTVWNPEVLGEVLALSCSFYSKNIYSYEGIRWEWL